jgi:hypothetical protein
MTKFHAVLLLLLASSTAYPQCSSLGISVSSSDTTNVQLYQAGFFLLPFGFANVCQWDITTFSGAIVHQATTSGEFPEQSFMYFDHTVPITDSTEVTLVITNDSSGIICTIIDTLYWQETEVIPGTFIGNWAILGSNGGLQTGLADRTTSSNINVFPSPAADHVRLTGTFGSCALSISDVNGALVATHANVSANDRVDVSFLPTGVYFIRIADESNSLSGIRKFVKL